MSVATPSDVVIFWKTAGPDRWFNKDAAFDRDIRNRFLATWEAAAAGKLADWERSDETADDVGTLALILVLDQFPRNMFRDDARAFSTDTMALAAANRAIAAGVDRRIDPALAPFIYMPLMHSEALADQERCVTLFRDFHLKGDNDPGRTNGLRYAEIHADIVNRFGRFPHRNRVLGRTTTKDEQAFLDSGGFSG